MNDTTWFWQIVDAHGLAEVSSDETVALREILNRSHRFEAEIEAALAAIGSPRFMDPPDGGDVSLAEQVRRMRQALETAEIQRDGAIEALSECEAYFDNRADADCDQDGFIPNKEMRLLSVVRATLQALENRKAVLADATNDPSDLSSLRDGDGTMQPRLSSLRKDAVGPAVSEGDRGHSAPVTSGAEVAVKPLEWRHDNAHSIIGRYWITYTGGKIGLHLDQRKIGKFADPDEAKSAAQSDFETRIRSALVSGSREDGA